MEVLVLLPELPSAGDKPADVRPRQFLAALRQAGIRAHVVAMRGPDQTAADEALCAGLAATVASFAAPAALPLRRMMSLLKGKSMSVMEHQSTALAAHLEKMGGAKRFDAAISFGAVMSAYVPRPMAMTILDLATPASSIMTARARAASGLRRWAMEAEAPLLQRLEHKELERSDLTLVSSPTDAARLSAMYKKKNVMTVHDGVNVAAKPSRESVIGGPSRIVMRADFTHEAYAVAVRQFLEQVWPSVRNLRRDAELVIVAQRPPAWLKAHEAERVRVVNGLDAFPEELRRGLMFISPWSAPRGLSMVVPQAMAIGVVPLVSPAVAAGLPTALRQHVVVADGANQWAATIERLLRDRTQAYSMVCRAQDAVRQHATPEAVWAPVIQLLQLTSKTMGRDPHFKMSAA